MRLHPLSTVTSDPVDAPGGDEPSSRGEEKALDTRAVETASERKPALPAGTEWVSTLGRLEALAAPWQALVERDPGASLFQSHPWLTAWLRHHPSSTPAVLIARQGERLTAAIPLCLHEARIGPFLLRTLRFAGDTAADYCDALVDPECPEDIAALWAQLRRRDAWDLMELRALPESSRLLQLAAADARVLRRHLQHQERVPYLELTGAWRELVARGLRAEMQRQRRRLHARGNVTLEVARTPNEVDDLLAQLAALHAARRPSRQQASLFQFAGEREWLRALCHDLLARDQLFLCRLAVNGEAAAVGLYFLWRRRLLCYTATYSDAFARFGPVHLLRMALLEHARGLDLADIHDFGRGAEACLPRWTRQARQLDRLLLARPTAAGRAAFFGLEQARAFLKKQHRLAGRARELRERLARRRCIGCGMLRCRASLSGGEA